RLGIKLGSGSHNYILQSMLLTNRVEQFNKLSLAMIRQAAGRARPMRLTGDAKVDAENDERVEACLQALGVDSPLSSPRRNDEHLHSGEREKENLLALTLQHAPFANANTFRICCKHCSRSRNADKLVNLLDLMVWCKIPPDINILNTLM